MKLARGNPHQHALNDAEPVLEPATTDPPAGLEGRALEEWARLASELVTKGVLTTGDLITFETYCRLWGDVTAYVALVEKVGREDAHKLGYAGYLLKLRGQLKQYAAELGLTPSSRSGVKVVKNPGAGAKEAKARRFFGGGNK